MVAVHAEIEHLLKEGNIINPGCCFFANTSMLLCWKHYMFMGRKSLRKRNVLMLLSFNECSIYALTAPMY